MFSLRKWVRAIADDAARAAVAKVKDEVQAEERDVMDEIDGELDDGTTLLYAREKKLLSALEWGEKAVAWQTEYKTEALAPSYTHYSDGSGFYTSGRLGSASPLAVAMRRAILEADVEIAEAAQKDAKDALASAKKAVTGAHS